MAGRGSHHQTFGHAAIQHATGAHVSVAGQGRSNIDFERWVELDLEYIDKWSLALDARILVKTIPAVLSGNGAV